MNGSARRRRWVAWALVVALLPSVLYVGHWSMRIPVPGTDSFIALGMRAEHEAQVAEGGHGDHCHGEASCTNAPPAPVMSGFAVVSEGLAFLGLASVTFVVMAVSRRLPAGEVVAPRPRPPRPAGVATIRSVPA